MLLLLLLLLLMSSKHGGRHWTNAILRRRRLQTGRTTRQRALHLLQLSALLLVVLVVLLHLLKATGVAKAGASAGANATVAGAAGVAARAASVNVTVEETETEDDGKGLKDGDEEIAERDGVEERGAANVGVAELNLDIEKGNTSGNVGRNVKERRVVAENAKDANNAEEVDERKDGGELRRNASLRGVETDKDERNGEKEKVNRLRHQVVREQAEHGKQRLQPADHEQAERRFLCEQFVVFARLQQEAEKCGRRHQHDDGERNLPNRRVRLDCKRCCILK